MITCDVDPNILRWGSEPECVNVENDAVIAHALQEELSRVAAAESSGFTNPSQNSILAQNWLNDIVAIRHEPKINGEMPSADEEISDHQRLLDRLQLYGLVENMVQGDGNCQFRSLSDQLYGSQEHHRFVREQVVSQLKSNLEMYEAYVPMAYCDYLKKMNENGEWGDHVTLQAAADSYGVKIIVLTSFEDTCYIEILPHNQKSERIYVSQFLRSGYTCAVGRVLQDFLFHVMVQIYHQFSIFYYVVFRGFCFVAKTKNYLVMKPLRIGLL